MVAPAQLLLVRGEVELMSGLYDEAIASLVAAAELAPGAPAVHLALARAYRAKGSLGQAEQQFRVYLELSAEPWAEAEVTAWLQGD
jgi:tetratricopeptide (TPR) repeat protein